MLLVELRSSACTRLRAASSRSHGALRTPPLPLSAAGLRGLVHRLGERWPDGQWLLQASSSSRRRVPFSPRGPRTAATHHLELICVPEPKLGTQAPTGQLGSHACPPEWGAVSALGNPRAESRARGSSGGRGATSRGERGAFGNSRGARRLLPGELGWSYGLCGHPAAGSSPDLWAFLRNIQYFCRKDFLPEFQNRGSLTIFTDNLLLKTEARSEIGTAT